MTSSEDRPKEPAVLASDSTSPRLDLRRGTQRVFAHLLVSNAVVAVINYTVWFAVTGIWFCSLVDNHHKRSVMQGSALASTGIYGVCLALYLLTPERAFTDVA